MKKSRIVMDHFLQLVFGSFIIYVTASCNGTIGTQIVIDEFHSFSNCSYEVMNCPKKSEPLDVNITGNPVFQIDKYKKIYNVWGDKSQAYLLYWDSNYTIRNIELPDIKGSLLVQTGYYDSDVDLYDFLKITLLNDAENFYIAYDSRVKTKPNWLTAKYEQMRHPNGTPYYIVVPTSKPSGDLRLEIWRRTSVPRQGDVVAIPGNIFGCSGPGCSGANMYVVIIKPKVTPNCPAGTVDAFVKKGIDGCFDTLAAADDMGRKDWLTNFATLQYGGISCDSVAPCPKESALKVETKVYPYNSEIEFDPYNYTSIADIKIDGNQFYNQKVKGNLDFEYQYQTNNMKLNSMILKMDPLKTDMGTFQDITVTLWKSTNAQCKDPGIPIYHRPCTHYEIAQGDFVVGLSAKLNEKDLLFAGANQNVMPITINHQTRTFNFQGPLQTVVKVDGKDTPLNIFVNLTGHFVNFAPKAFGQESTKHVECGISRIGGMKSGNKDPVKLDSVGSFAIYDTFLTNPPIYQWYEDFGLVTERLWGSGSKYIIAPYNLGFGVHNITLLVKDKHGIVDTDTFDVEVRDTIPPELTVPKDITIHQTAVKKHPVKVKVDKVKVDIGQAQAYDTCSQKVMISNDAPKGLLFSPGTTIVTWTADDGHGNLTKKTQKVSVITP